MKSSKSRRNQSMTDITKCKAIAKLPRWAVLRESLELLSPVVWWRSAAFKHINLHPFYMSILAMVVPATGIYFGSRHRDNKLQSNSRTIQFVLISWSLACLYPALKVASKVAYAVSGFVTTKSSALPSAWQCLAARIQSDAAYRTSSYDVYLPQDLTPATVPIMLFPGASVEHTAYAEPASLLADNGYLVVVVSSRPVNLVDIWLPRFWPSTLRSLQRGLERQYFGTTCGRDWVLMGHSMGSFLCTKLSARLKNVLGIVLWGSAPFNDYIEENMSDDVPTLVVQATNDDVIKMFATADAWKEFWKRLPSQSTRHDIQDGTHSGFASYTPSWKPEVSGIPRAAQQQEAVRVSADFIRQLLV